MIAAFVDVDGVLNNRSTRGHTPSGFIGVSNELIRRLRTIVDETGARIVLSSDWRLTRDDREHRKDYRYLEKKLKSVAGLEIYDHTVDISWPRRGDMIRKYLRDHPGITEFVILDDTPFRSFETCGLLENLVLTDPSAGLTDDDVTRAIRILQGAVVEPYQF